MSFSGSALIRSHSNRNDPAKTQSVLPLIWIVLVALTLRIAVIPFVVDEWFTPYNLQHYEQGNVAQALEQGRGFGSPFLSQQPSAVLPPVYPLLLAGIFKLLGTHTHASMIAALAMNCLFSALAVIPVFLVARRSFSERAARWAAWAWAFCPYGIYFAAEWPWPTHLLLLCLCWMLYLAQRMEASSSLTLWAGFGVLAGFAGLTEPSVLVVVPLLLGLAVAQRIRARVRWAACALAASLTLAAGLTPWTIRNAEVFHRFVPLRDSLGLELWLGNNGDSAHWRHGDLHPNHSAAELAEYNRNGELAFMDHKFQQAESYIQNHPRWYVWMTARRIAYLWTGYWSFDQSYLREEPLDPPNIVLTSAMTMLALLGLALAWRERRVDAIRYGGVLFLYPILYALTHPEAYRMRPLDPLLLVLGCHAIHSLLGARVRREDDDPVAAMGQPSTLYEAGTAG